MDPNLFFYIGLAFILVHEMDAIQQKEWRIFPGLSHLEDRAGYLWFTALHVPLYILLFWGLWQNETEPNLNLVIGLDIFFMVHLLLHIMMYRHKKNLFTSFFSWTIIVGAGICGGLDLLIKYG